MPVSLVPDRVLRHYTDVTPRLLGELGVKLLLCDLDYTLAPRSVSAPDGAFCGALGIWYVGHAGKPSVKGFRRAMDQAGAGPEETAMLGDKLLTDVLGARRSGVKALMVEPLGGPAGTWNRVLHALQEPFKQIAKRRNEEK